MVKKRGRLGGGFLKINQCNKSHKRKQEGHARKREQGETNKERKMHMRAKRATYNVQENGPASD